jgi:coniferyl-aldehyde dehydrogenase
MTITENRTATTGDDAAAIAELHEIVEHQRAAFLRDPFPSLEERQALLAALAGMLMSHRTQVQEAMSSDFGVHPPLAADLIEVLGPAGRAMYAGEQLGSWMAAEPRLADPALYGSGRAFVQPQP